MPMGYETGALRLRCERRDPDAVFGALCEPASDPPKAFDLVQLEEMAKRATGGLLVFSMPDGTMVVAADLPNIIELLKRANHAD